MRFYFDIEKTLAAAGHVLKVNRGRMNYMNLLKTLYVADRQAFIKWQRTVTGDAPESRPNGPVLRKVLELLNGDGGAVQSSWNEFISERDDYTVRLLKAPNEGCLSERERVVLNEANTRFGTTPFNQLVRAVHNHQHFPEWKHPRPKGHEPIDFAHVLRSGANMSDSEIRAVSHELDHLRQMKSRLA